MNTINWDEFVQGISNLNNIKIGKNRERTNIICPKCGALVFKITDKVFTSYPPKYRYECEECNWVDYI